MLSRQPTPPATGRESLSNKLHLGHTAKQHYAYTAQQRSAASQMPRSLLLAQGGIPRGQPLLESKALTRVEPHAWPLTLEHRLCIMDPAGQALCNQDGTEHGGAAAMSVRAVHQHRPPRRALLEGPLHPRLNLVGLRTCRAKVEGSLEREDGHTRANQLLVGHGTEAGRWALAGKH